MLSEALWRKRNLESIKEIEGKPCFTPRTNLSVCTISYFSMSPLFHSTSTETNGNVLGELF